MIANPDKFKSINLTKNKSDDIPTGISTDTDIVSMEIPVKLLAIHNFISILFVNLLPAN